MTLQLPHEIGGLLAVDLDETLVDVNTFPSLVRLLPGALVRSRRPAAVARLGVALIRRKLLRGSHADLKSEVCRLVDLADGASLDEWTMSMLEEHGDDRLIRAVGLWDGPTLLTSAAPESVVRRIAEAVGFDHAHGSVRDGSTFVENVSTAKVERLRSSGLDRPALAISDEPELDGPLLRYANRQLVVRMDRSLSPFEPG